MSFWSIFFQGVMLGFGLVIPMGPINVLIIAYALVSLKVAIAFGFGALSADIVYFTLLNVGVLAFLKGTIMMKALALFGSVFLTYIAVMIIKGANRPLDISKAKQIDSPFKSYIKGLFLGFANPYAITFWLSIAAISAGYSGGIVFLALGFFIASSLWLILLPLAINKSRAFISQKAIKLFAYFSAIIIMFFVFKLIYENFLV